MPSQQQGTVPQLPAISDPQYDPQRLHFTNRVGPANHPYQHGYTSYPPHPMYYPLQSTPTQHPHFDDHATAMYNTTPLGNSSAYFLEPALPTTSRSQHNEPIASHSSLDRLTDAHHSILLQQLTKHAAAWKMIGTYLGFTQGELNNIQANQLLAMNSPVSWLNEMLFQWLQWVPRDSRGSTSFATLESLKAALNQARLGAAAHDLKV